MSKPEYRVCELRDDNDLPRYIFAVCGGNSPWRPIWEHRAELPGALAEWFRTLDTPPLEHPCVGFVTNERTARALVAFRIREINELATGSANEWADFLLNCPPIKNRKKGRVCTIVGPDGVREYPTLQAAAAAEGLHPNAIWRRVRQGRIERGGRIGL